jgi:DNA-binding MarR family transcriptional regulator
VTLVVVTRAPTDDDYARLLAFRTRLREFQRWSQESAAALGLTAAQHQLLLAVRGHPGPQPPTMGDLASHLLVRHHTAVGLVDRAQALGLVTRLTDEGDHRVVRLALTGTAGARPGGPAPAAVSSPATDPAQSPRSARESTER